MVAFSGAVQARAKLPGNTTRRCARLMIPLLRFMRHLADTCGMNVTTCTGQETSTRSIETILCFCERPGGESEAGAKTRD